MSVRSLVIVVSTVLGLSISGCDEPGSEPLCTPGSTQQCFCPNGTTGAQSCSEDGSQYQACVCSGVPVEDVAMDVPSDTSAPDAADDSISTGDTQADMACPSGERMCGDQCVDVNTDVNHCGACNNTCPGGAQGTPQCSSGTCTLACSTGYFDCNAEPSDGCETPFSCEQTLAVGLGQGAATSADLSADGRYVVFASQADDLVANDTNAASDIFMLDRANGSITRISTALDGGNPDAGSFDPVIDAAGAYVAYTSEAQNLVAFDLNGHRDVFLYAVETGTTTRVSMASDGSEANGPSIGRPAISSGRYVAFASEASNLVSDDNNAVSDVFVFDRESNQLERVSVSSTGEEGNAASTQPSLSGDGSLVAFTSRAQNLVQGGSPLTAFDVYLHERRSVSTSRLTANWSTPRPLLWTQTTFAHSPALSADGHHVAFISNADFGLGPSPYHPQGLVVDTQTGQLELLTRGANNTASNGATTALSISRDGRFVPIASQASNLAPLDFNTVSDIFLIDRQGGTSRLNVAPDGSEANDASVLPVVSADGRFVAFISSAANLDASDNNAVADVFITATGLNADAGEPPRNTCASGEIWCVGDGCVTPECGVCGAGCVDTQTCQSGTCTCPSGNALCYGLCSSSTTCSATFSLDDQTLSERGYHVALGDVDDDGDLDALLLFSQNPHVLLLNNGSGGFSDSGQTLGESGRDAAFGDLDNDGDLDMYIAISGASDRVWLNDGKGVFTHSGQTLEPLCAPGWPSTCLNSSTVSLGDVNGDGTLDALVSIDNSGPNQIWLNDGSGLFSLGQDLSAYPRVQGGDQRPFNRGSALGDLDGDGDLDAFITQYQGGFPSFDPDNANRVWLNDGTGVFTETGQTIGNSTSYDVSLGDLDGDGDLDAIVANDRQPVRVWMNDGKGTFSGGQSYLNLAIHRRAVLGDLDGDGDLDAYIARDNRSTNPSPNANDMVLWNDGSGMLTESLTLPLDVDTEGVALGDLDGDRDLDAMFINAGSTEPRFIWLNQR